MTAQILDGKILADNRPYYEITVIPQDMGLADQTLNSLGQLLSIQAQTFKSQLNALKYQPHFMPVVLIEDADFESISKIKQYQQPEYDESHNGIYLAGVDVSLYPLRTYLYPELFSHVLGYLKEPNPKNLEDLEKMNYYYNIESVTIDTAGQNSDMIRLSLTGNVYMLPAENNSL